MSSLVTLDVTQRSLLPPVYRPTKVYTSGSRHGVTDGDADCSLWNNPISSDMKSQQDQICNVLLLTVCVLFTLWGVVYTLYFILYFNS